MNRKDKLFELLQTDKDIYSLELLIADFDEMIELLDNKIQMYEKLNLVDQVNQLCEEYLWCCKKKISYEKELLNLKLWRLNKEEELLEE